MTNFNDLPKAVRERIYRLHLVRDEPISLDAHLELIKHKYCHDQHRFMPPLLTLSPKIDKEAAAFYYGSNHFVFSTTSDTWSMCWSTWPRHLRLVRQVTLTWKEHAFCATECFDNLAKMKSLAELYIRIDEKAMLRKMLLRRKAHQRYGWDDPTPQQQLAILQFPGMVGLLRLSGISRVQFLPMLDRKGEEYGGSIPGGVLETQVAPRIMREKSLTRTNRSSKDSFPFLSLSPELRNRIYDMLLRVPGRLQLSPKPVQSAAKKQTPRESSLNLLAVNKQIHDEAVGIFYHYNSFDFHYSLHMHGFLLSLGTQRQTFVRDIKLHYADIKSGGMSLVELTFPLLRQLSGLHRLEIVMHGELAGKIVRRGYWASRYSMGSANPCLIPGMKALFELRGVTDIKVRDLHLERQFETAKNEGAYPDFATDSRNACVVKIAQALEHFNSALADAQVGRVNWELLKDTKWQVRDVFPMLKPVELRGSPEL